MAKGATPIDFAYAVHTEVGHACVGARVNGRLVSLSHQLTSGDTCEIFTSKVEGTGPSRDWLQIVQTPRAANKIRQWFSRERREDARETGREDFQKQLRKEGLPTQKLPAGVLEEVAARPQLRRRRRALHRHRRAPRLARSRWWPGINRLLRSGDPEREEQLPTSVTRPVHHAVQPRRAPASTSRASTTSWSGCRAAARRCPATRSSASSPGAAACRSTGPTAPTPRRSRPASATASSRSSGTSDLSGGIVRGLHRGAGARPAPACCGDVSGVLAEHKVNIIACNMKTDRDRMASMRFDCELGDPSHLDAVLGRIRGIDGVYESYRVLPGAGAAD